MKASAPVLFATAPVASACLAFATMMLVTWSISADDVARFGMFQYLSSGGLLVLTMGLDQAYLRELGETPSAHALLRACLQPCLGLMLLGITIIGLNAGAVAEELFQLDDPAVVWLSLANLAILVFHRFAAQHARMSEQGGNYLLAELAIKSPLMFGLAFWVSRSNESLFVELLWLQLLGTAIAALLVILPNRRIFLQAFGGIGGASAVSSQVLFKFGLPLAFAGLLYWGVVSGGVFFTKYWLGLNAAAPLVVATSLSNIAQLGQAVFSLLWLPIAYRWIKDGLECRSVEIVAMNVTIGACWFMVMVTLLVHVIPIVFKEEYRHIAPLATGLCVLPILYTLSEVTLIGLMVNRRSDLALLASLLTLTVSLIGNAVVTPWLGPKGAALVVAIASLTLLVARTEFACFSWAPISRRHIYFGGASICASGCVSALLPTPISIVALLLLAPFMLIYRAQSLVLIRTLLYETRRFLFR
jgi:O-antigen/teichoic acid export membrane protein